MPMMAKLRVGLIGCGAFGEIHLATFKGLPYVEVIGVSDLSEERAGKLAERYGVPSVAKDFRELCSRKDLDAVSVVTTEDQHLEPVLFALGKGKHVFVEKPMATRVEDAEKMVKAAQETGLILMPGHILRFETKYARVKERLESGALGQIVSIYARRNRMSRLASVYKRTHIVLENSIHDIDIMLWYTNARVKYVRCYDVSAGGSGPDLSCGVVRFQDGAVGLFQASWLLPNKTQALDDCMQVVTTAGVANVDILHSGLTIWGEEGHEVLDVSYDPRLRGRVFGAMHEELSYFALSVLEGRQPTVVTARDGLEAVRVALALIESAQFDREIHLAGCS